MFKFYTAYHREDKIFHNLCVIGLFGTLFGVWLEVSLTISGNEFNAAALVGAIDLLYVLLTFLISLFIDFRGNCRLGYYFLPYSLLLSVIFSYFCLGYALPLMAGSFTVPVAIGIILLETRGATILVITTIASAVLLQTGMLVFHLYLPLTMAGQNSQLVANLVTIMVVLPTISALMLISTLQRRLARQTIQAQKEQLEVTLRSITNGVVAINKAGEVILLNRVAGELTGLTQEESLGLPLGAVIKLGSTESTQKLLEQVCYGGQTIRIEDQWIGAAARGDELRLIEGSIAPIRTGDQEIKGAVLVFSDITEQHLMAAELEKTSRAEALGTLAGGIAHDFNNLLTVVLGNLSSIHKSEERKGVFEEELEAALTATGAAKDLVRQLLTFARGDEPLKKQLDFEELVKQAANFARHGSSHELEFEIEPGTWTMEGDKTQLTQVINNLVLNAIQAQSEVGRIRLKIENLKLEEGNGYNLAAGLYIKLTIQDWGSGIRPEHLPRIFDPYFTTKPGGHGLGLATSFSIIKKHTGSIKVESVWRKGTTVEILLPATVSKKEPARTVEAKKGEIKRAKRPGLKVLVMDDEPAILQLARKVLERQGYQVRTARNGEETLALYLEGLVRGQGFEVVIMDLTIVGGMGGKEAVRELLALDSEAKVIVSSGYSSDPILENYKEYGFVGVVTKPYTIGELMKAMEEVLAGNRK